MNRKLLPKRQHQKQKNRKYEDYLRIQTTPKMKMIPKRETTQNHLAQDYSTVVVAKLSPKPSPSWAEIALISSNTPTPTPPGHRQINAQID